MTTLINICSGIIICCLALIAIVGTVVFIVKMINDEL